MGCGGSIRKALKETCAVDQVAVRYIDTLEEQTIVVNYDRKKIAPEQIISVLSKINDKQFEVRLLGSPKQL
jgi:copper chaperone CopZ